MMDRIDVNDRDSLNEAARQLYEAIEFPMMECKKALFVKDGDLSEAAEYLASGAWASAKSVSWNWDSLREKTAQLASETGESDIRCLSVLKNCNGNVALAKRKLAGLPALPR